MFQTLYDNMIFMIFKIILSLWLRCNVVALGCERFILNTTVYISPLKPTSLVSVN